jgi:hypothetical protein
VHTLRVRIHSKLVILFGPPPPLELAFPRGSHSATADPEQECNKGIPDRLQVPQADQPVIGLHNRSLEWGREKIEPTT